MSDTIRFYFRGALQELRDAPPTQTVLQYLREERRCTGTKEGCAEGDCGACMVVIASLRGGALSLDAVNACIQFTPTLDGKALFTVEDLRQPDGSLHPVQQAMVDCHASQCGFCTPGVVMSLWAMYQRGDGAPPRGEIDDALSGNLCRCTGYRPIIDAARRMGALPRVEIDRAALLRQLRGLRRDGGISYRARGQQFHLPRTVDELVRLRADHPDACLLSGSTDVGLWVTKQLRTLDDIIYLGQVDALKRIEAIGDTLEIGAGATLNAAYAALCRHYPDELGELWRRFASLPIRNAGTLGGNVANGSPIGDSMPWLIALGSQLALRGAQGRRMLALEDFYLGYRQTDLRPGEFVEAVRVPLRREGLRLRTYKLAKRFDQDISAVCAAFALTLAPDGVTIATARIAFGGMAATPQRARRTEALLAGAPWDAPTLAAAMDMLARDYAPRSDQRASGAYRMTAARNLLRRFWLETRAEAALAADAVNVFARPSAGAPHG